MQRRWDPCVVHRERDVRPFVSEYFAKADRKILLIGGAGFDPRSHEIAALLSKANPCTQALFVRENRRETATVLTPKAEQNIQRLKTSIPTARFEGIQIFGADGAIVGGRNVIKALSQVDYSAFTDVVVDVSALSVGMSFPAIRFLQESAQAGAIRNLHIFVAHDPKLDFNIKPIAGDSASYVHTFQGKTGLDAYAEAARLWLPQLASGRRAALTKLFDLIIPHDTCPILPFPSSDPRLGDRLAEEFTSEIESAWEVDARNIVYADESDPLDLYRTILQLSALREAVFAEAGSSLVILSPVGSKIMAIGSLMAALELDLPVALVEAVDYTLEHEPTIVGEVNLLHVWLEGEIYPPRPLLTRV